jgi:hypothetical protein
MYADIQPVITALREQHSPFTTPPLLSMFIEILAGYLTGGLDNEDLQTFKQRELFLILQTLYPRGHDNDVTVCDGLS